MAKTCPPTSFEDKGGQRLRRKLADPSYAARITEIREGMRDMEQLGAAGTDQSGTSLHDQTG
ncbi:hypothetical protein [Mycobacteroides abscessus]|uniref:hypothetical protein n=1 Tax=Mycobacteroides abscessus TaxID=36809 RepID=UPI00089DD413|nr:hypothetical protein [Mycobacteroides abscessus]MBN7428898.1 hypothetical protein [Mycobacteroides abscessus subsp. massiliense]MBN7468954.1 hypothetical protein [Mycobacteroides abscessus subsp. massiliense]MBN7527484.1 hypothetical protein [Mycobacteroides abscessus subsp. massiliense]MBN7567313.1 hypothetical protein [Mycobacteroides abscessus subsp. massiliense]MDM3940798.1 hypothetical protein [Mycobacteroides abscessus]